ncbi:MAG: hypothetical protein QGG01_12025, partial [Roseibacillus sp.]|nr:hypothetical protein [Roseibacillus sp.]
MNHAAKGPLLVALVLMTGIGPAPGQAPGIIDPFGSNSELYHRANRYYSYGNDSRDIDDKRRAYQMSIPLFREYLATGPQGDLVQQASYQLGMALLLTGEREAAERAFTT